MADLIPKNWRIDPRAETHVIADTRSICSISFRDNMDPEGAERANRAIAELVAQAPGLQALNAEMLVVLEEIVKHLERGEWFAAEKIARKAGRHVIRKNQSQ